MENERKGANGRPYAGKVKIEEPIVENTEPKKKKKRVKK
jgi:hypothetical protein